MHDEFLTALRENPHDDVSRLVYADWLDEQDDSPGSPEGAGPGTVLAEFLRVEVRLASPGLPDDERVGLLNRLAELGRRAEPGWLLAVNRSPVVRLGLRKAASPSPLEGKLELANYSTRRLTIAFDAHLLQYLRFRVTDPLGRVTDGRYEKFPALAGVRYHGLSPASRMSLGVNLLNPIPVREITVGRYTIEAAYEYDGVRCRADPLTLELTDEDRKVWKLGRFAPK